MSETVFEDEDEAVHVFAEGIVVQEWRPGMLLVRGATIAPASNNAFWLISARPKP